MNKITQGKLARCLPLSQKSLGKQKIFGSPMNSSLGNLGTCHDCHPPCQKSLEKQAFLGSRQTEWPGKTRQIPSTMAIMPRRTATTSKIRKETDKYFWEHCEQCSQERLAQLHPPRENPWEKTSISGTTTNKMDKRLAKLHPQWPKSLGEQAFLEHREQVHGKTRHIPSTMSKIPRKTSVFGNTVNTIPGKTKHMPSTMSLSLKETSIFGSTASNVAKKDSPNSIHHVKNRWENKRFWDHDEQSGQARFSKLRPQWSKIPRKTSILGAP